MPAATGGRGDVARADHHDGGQRASREGLLDAGVDLHHRQVARQPLHPGVDGVQAERRDRQRDQHGDRAAARTGPAGAAPRRRSWPRSATRRSAERSGYRSGTRPRSTLSPSLESTAGRTVSEPTIEIATTSTVPTAKDENVLRAHQEHPRHRDDHGQARHEHGAPRGRRCGLERVGRDSARALALRARGADRTASSRPRRRGRSAGSPS